MWHTCNYSEENAKDTTTYDGRDLTKIFASEIANFPSPWHWIQNRLNHRNYKGLNHGDFIPLTVDGETHEMQININTYKRTTDQELDDHIDFISRDCYSQTVQWNTTNNNNGTAAQPFPYLASNVKQFLDQLYNKLPQALQNLIVSKRSLLEKRYSSSGTLTDSTGWDWADLGKLWLPSEYEVFGSTVWATKGWSAGQAMQYPIFANSWKNRIKGAGPKGARCHWWLLTVGGASATYVCFVSYYGYADRWNTSDALRVPLCFRFVRQAQS